MGEAQINSFQIKDVEASKTDDPNELTPSKTDELSTVMTESEDGVQTENPKKESSQDFGKASHTKDEIKINEPTSKNTEEINERVLPHVKSTASEEAPPPIEAQTEDEKQPTVSWKTIQKNYEDVYWLKVYNMIQNYVYVKKDDDTKRKERQGEDVGIDAEPFSPEEEEYTKVRNDVYAAKYTDEALSAEARAKRRESRSRKQTSSEKEESGWKISADKNGIMVEHRKEDDTNIHSVMVSLEIMASIPTIVPIMMEADLIPNFVPSFIGMDCKVLEHRGVFGLLIYMKMSLPPPFKNRYSVLDCCAVDSIDENGGVLVLVRSVDPPEGCELPPSSVGAVVVEVKSAGCLLVPTGTDLTSFSNFMNVDLKIPLVPAFLLNFLTRHVTYFAFVAFREKAKSFGAEGLPPQYEERIRADPRGTYRTVEERFRRASFPPSPLKFATFQS